MYSKLMKTQSKEEEEVRPYVQMTLCHWRRKGGDLTKQCPMKTYMMLVRVISH